MQYANGIGIAPENDYLLTFAKKYSSFAFKDVIVSIRCERQRIVC